MIILLIPLAIYAVCFLFSMSFAGWIATALTWEFLDWSITRPRPVRKPAPVEDPEALPISLPGVLVILLIAVLGAGAITSLSP